MKGFLRTIPGKSVAFIVCVFSICVLAVSIITGGFMYEFDYYTRDKEVIYKEIADRKMQRDIYYDVLTAVNTYENETCVMEEHDGLSYRIRRTDNTIIAQTEGAKAVDNWENSFDYVAVRDVNGELYIVSIDSVTDDQDEYYMVDVNIDKTSGSYTYYSFFRNFIDKTYSLKYVIYIIAIVALIMAIMSFVVLMSVAGRRNGDDGLYPGPLNIVPFDIMLAAFIALVIGFVIIVDGTRQRSLLLMVVAIDSVLLLSLAIGLCMSLAVRIKQKSLIKGSFIYFCIKVLLKALKYLWTFLVKVLQGIMYLVRGIPLVWKTVIVLTAVCLYELAFFFQGYDREFWGLEKMVLVPAIIYLALTLRTLQKGGAALAKGDLAYRINTNRMFWDFKKHGENLNDIGKGMAIAVNEQLKSERMKTELITNVSHDIKTPLTSIVNYAGLISEEKTENEKIKEYTEVLLRQSEKLKRLIDDLVEASKASTGNLDVHLVPCDSSVFVNQAVGEYVDKFEESGLILVTNTPEEELRIMADSRRMWRIFDNLMNNIVKYAQPNTRVYLSLERIDDQAVFSFKNTSREQLNISEEELMERFTRGDTSRNTEGNGLGLSIAKSMTELQKGELRIAIDGDLFKALLSFPLI